MDALAFLAFLAPMALGVAARGARREPGLRPQRTLRAAQAATLFSLALALPLLAAALAWGPVQSPLLGFGGLGIAVRLDTLSALMFTLVSGVGALVVRFSRNYLDGDPRQGEFVAGLCLTLAAVLTLVLAGNLLQLVCAWIGTSLALHGLLVFYRERPGALSGARKKFVVARLGDACLVVAALLLVRAFGTGDLGALLEAGARLRDAAAVPAGVGAAAVLVVVAAALKSAMFPTHGWLLEVMETPTPVSALLHAGLINAGTFLVVRLGDLVLLSTPAVDVLLLVGGATALLASIAMVTQSSVKISLAWSSAAHMGFMLMLCGLGAHAAAILHLIAHSCYKAHAFLSSGSVVDYVRATGSEGLDVTPRPALVGVGLAAALAIYVGLGMLLGVPLAERPASMALGAILVMATAHLIARGLGDAPKAFVTARGAISAAGVTLAFFALEGGANAVLHGSVAATPRPDALTIAIVFALVLAFAAVTLLQTWLPAHASRPRWRAAYVHMKHGLYANALFDRLIGALR